MQKNLKSHCSKSNPFLSKLPQFPFNEYLCSTKIDCTSDLSPIRFKSSIHIQEPLFAMTINAKQALFVVVSVCLYLSLYKFLNCLKAYQQHLVLSEAARTRRKKKRIKWSDVSSRISNKQFRHSVTNNTYMRTRSQ